MGHPNIFYQCRFIKSVSGMWVMGKTRFRFMLTLSVERERARHKHVTIRAHLHQPVRAGLGTIQYSCILLCISQ